MSKRDDIAFTLINAESAEIIGTAETAVLGGATETEKTFSDIMCGGFVGRLGKHEVARTLGAEIRDKIGEIGPVISNSRAQLLLIPHHFSLRPIEGALPRTLSSVGIIVNFETDDQTLTIIDLLPSARFRTVFGAHINGEIDISFSTLAGIFATTIGISGAVPEEALHDKSRFGFTLNFGHSFFASDVAVTGTGTRTAVFEFFSGAEPLVGKDLVAWSAVLFNAYATETRYRVKLFYTSRLAGIPSHCETQWADCKAMI
jgi:hypothetical protein